MRYKLLGKSGLRVSELALGTMTFGETWGWGASKDVSKQQVELFAEKGGNFIDTAVNYTDGTSEEFVGDIIKAEREYWVLATKYTLTKPDSLDPNSGGNSRKNMMKSLERSLKRLQTDYVDILYLHMWDYMTPVEEVMRGLDDLVRMGKVNYVAISDTPSYIVAEGQTRWRNCEAGRASSACKCPIHCSTAPLNGRLSRRPNTGIWRCCPGVCWRPGF